MNGFGDDSVDKIYGSGQANFGLFCIQWEFFSRNISIIVNGNGGFAVSGPHDVLEIEPQLFAVKYKPWKCSEGYSIKCNDDYTMEIYYRGNRLVLLKKVPIPAS
jgi:hypothetical protein